MNNYLVTLVDKTTGQMQKIWVESECPDGMQEFINDATLDPPLLVKDPVVVDITQHRHIFSVAS